MTWAILGMGIALLIVLSWVIVRLTVTVSQASTNALASITALDARHQAERKSLIDRLMSQDWQAVRLHESAEYSEPGGFIPPEEQTEEPTLVTPGLWGTARSAQDRADALDAATQLAAEDDLDSYRAESELSR